MIPLRDAIRLNLSGRILNHVLVFLINLMMVRLIDPEKSGFYFNELYLAGLLAFLLSAGLDFAVVKRISAHPEQGRALWHLLVGWWLLASGCSWLLLLLWSEGNWPAPTQSAPILFLFLSGSLGSILFQGLMTGQKRFALTNRLLFFPYLAFWLWLLWLSVFPDAADFPTITTGYALMFFLQGLLLAGFSRPDTAPSSEPLKPGPLLLFGCQTMATSVVYFCLLRADNFFVERYCDPVTLSQYVQCGKIGQYFLYFSSLIGSTLLPYLSGRNPETGLRPIFQTVRPLLPIVFVSALLLALTGPWLFPLLFGPAYAGMYPYLMLMLPGYLLLSVSTLINVVYLSRGKTGRMFRADLLGLLLLVVLDGWLVPRFGAEAAAGVSSVCYAAVFVYLWMDFRQEWNSNQASNKN